MGKKAKVNKPSHPLAKRVGHSSGSLVVDPVLKDKTTPKILSARKKNNPARYT